MDREKVLPFIEKATELYRQIKNHKEVRDHMYQSTDVTPILSIAHMLFLADVKKGTQPVRHLVSSNALEQFLSYIKRASVLYKENRHGGWPDIKTSSEVDPIFYLAHLMCLSQSGGVASTSPVDSAEGLEPYVKVRAQLWNLDCDDDKTSVNEVNEVLRALGAEWTPLESYVKDGETLPFTGSLYLSEDELYQFQEGEMGYITVFYKNNGGQHLRLDVDLEDEDISFELTTFFPNFVQGVNDLRLDCAPQTKRDLIAIMENLSQKIGDPDEIWDEGDITAETGADRYEKFEF